MRTGPLSNSRPLASSTSEVKAAVALENVARHQVFSTTMPRRVLLHLAAGFRHAGLRAGLGVVAPHRQRRHIGDELHVRLEAARGLLELAAAGLARHQVAQVVVHGERVQARRRAIVDHKVQADRRLERIGVRVEYVQRHAPGCGGAAGTSAFCDWKTMSLAMWLA